MKFGWRNGVNPPKFQRNLGGLTRQNFFMHYVYILQSKRDGNLYAGCTNDLKRRLLMHNSKRIISTRKRTPLNLIYYEAFINQQDAFNREKWLKTGWGRSRLKKILNNYFIHQKPK